ncbi:MAG TPA: hypothetical protein VM933_03690 [Acidimicrobiales bacterium]|nr:hypothetical protein [Acidimicrobiales bacterium]
MDWRVPDGDETRTWRRGWGGPKPRLEQDWYLAYSRAAVGCYEAIGAFTCMLDGAAIVHGHPYERVPVDDPADVQRRRDDHLAEGEVAVDEGTDLWEAEIRPEVESLLTTLRRRRPRSNALPRLVAHVERAMDVAAHVMGDLHWRMAFGIPGDWTTDYARLCDGTEAEAAEFLQGLDHATSRLLRRLRHLARLHRDNDPAFEGELAGCSAATAPAPAGATGRRPAFATPLGRWTRRRSGSSSPATPKPISTTSNGARRRRGRAARPPSAASAGATGAPSAGRRSSAPTASPSPACGPWRTTTT